jgi:hypothetical protein
MSKLPAVCSLVALVLGGCAGTGSGVQSRSASQPDPPKPALKGSTPSPATAVPPGHVVVVIMENKDYSFVIGNPDAPYINALAGRYALATNDHANEHPSLPNYLDLTAGSDMGIHDDGESYVLSGPQLLSQLSSAGYSWAAYMESMPADATAPCSLPSFGLYRKKHNPFSYWTWLQGNSGRCRRVKPFSSLDPSAMERFVWITPNMCHSTHDCSLAIGDAWLRANLPPILQRMSGSDVLFLTWDEGTTAEGGGHIVTIVAGPGAKRGFTDGTAYSHYSLLLTVEDLFGVACLRHTCDPGVHSMLAMLR